MPNYRVRTGQTVAHAGAVHEAGARLDLPRAIADDMAVRGSLEEIDDKGNPVDPVPASDLDRFRTHERVGLLRERLKAAQDTVAAIQAQLSAEEQRLVAEVKAIASPAAPTTKPSKAQPPAADTKE